MSNIYDEAQKEIGNDWVYPNAYKALEHAKKVEELLGLYQSVYGVVEVWNTMPYIDKKIKQLEEELK